LAIKSTCPDASTDLCLEKDKAVWQEDKVEMQTRIDYLLAELKLSKSQK
jgi:hypothetical protein